MKVCARSADGQLTFHLLQGPALWDSLERITKNDPGCSLSMMGTAHEYRDGARGGVVRTGAHHD